MQPTQEIKETVTCSCTVRAFLFLSLYSGRRPTTVTAVLEQPSLVITIEGEIHVLPQLTTHTHSSGFHSLTSNTHQVNTDLWLHVTRADANSTNLPPTQPQILKALIRPCKSLNIHLLVVQEVCLHTCMHTGWHEKLNTHAQKYIYGFKTYRTVYKNNV